MNIKIVLLRYKNSGISFVLFNQDIFVINLEVNQLKDLCNS